MSAFDYSQARSHLLNMGACDRCVGRQFFRLFQGMDHGELGSRIRQSETLMDARHANVDEVILRKGCPLCGGHFLDVPEFVEKAIELVRSLEYSTYLVGCQVEGKLLAKEEDVWLEVGAEHSEPLKKDLVRQIGIGIGKATGKEAEFSKPDVIILADFTSGKVSIDIRPLFLYGEYKKFERGIPQTKWPCRKCRGRGCKSCGFTGKMYEESVEELVSKVLLDETGAQGEKFHGSGREDIDATMLGGRPFVVELQRPLLRFLDWGETAKKINLHAKGKVEVGGLRQSSKGEVVSLKAAQHDKSYEAIIECSKTDGHESLEKEFSGREIEQRTPERVSHRRADLIRKRTVHSVLIESAGPGRLRAVIKAQSGTYIKELISGDNGRTRPSFADFIGPCKCAELNVLEVHKND